MNGEVEVKDMTSLDSVKNTDSDSSDSNLESSVDNEQSEFENKAISARVDDTNIEASDSPIQNVDNNHQNKFFFTEIMSTAGPRKNFLDDAREGDYDLGEDTVGCFVKKNKAFFWLLDGTSDTPIFLSSDKKEIISSRLLSQDIGWNLQRIIWENSKITSSENALRDCMISIVEDWQLKLNFLSETDKERLNDILSVKNSMTVSSTAIFGMLDIDGSLNVSQIGDSFLVTNPITSIPIPKGRFFLVIKAKPEDKSFIVESNSFEDTRCITTSLDHIKTIIIGTDGVSQNTQKWLQMKPANFTDPAFRKIISAIKHGTCDDKALCVIQILNDD